MTPTLTLRELEEGDEAALREAVREFAESDPDWEFAFYFDEKTDFPGYVARLRNERAGADLPEGWVPHTYLVAIIEGRIIGRVSLRHELNDYLREYGGHIGFGVVASARRRGYATEILRQTLRIARALGLDRVLVTCDDDNLGSIGTIEACAGVLEDTRDREGGGITRRYWIDLASPPIGGRGSP